MNYKEIKLKIQKLKAMFFEILTGEYVVKALWSFTAENYLFFLLDYMPGGDLGSILKYYCRFEEVVARYYIEQIIQAIGYLHSIDIIHKDLKPENVLIDQDGFIKLADFGLSEVGIKNKLNQQMGQQGIQQSQITPQNRRMSGIVGLNLEDPMYSILNIGISDEKQIGFQVELKKNSNLQSQQENKHVRSPTLKSINASFIGSSGSYNNKVNHRIIGTPDYIAPEVISGQSTNNKTMDWWSLGVILYELICGIPPFNADTVEEIFKNIQNKEIEWPEIGHEEDQMSPECHDLCQKLMEYDYTKRLGANGVEEIQNHPWFKGTDWANLKKKPALLIPQIVGEEEDQNDQEAIQRTKQKTDQARMKLDQLLNSKNQTTKNTNENLKDVPNLLRTDLLAQMNNQQVQKLKIQSQEEEQRRKDRLEKLNKAVKALKKSQPQSNYSQFIEDKIKNFGSFFGN